MRKFDLQRLALQAGPASLVLQVLNGELALGIMLAWDLPSEGSGVKQPRPGGSGPEVAGRGIGEYWRSEQTKACLFCSRGQKQEKNAHWSLHLFLSGVPVVCPQPYQPRIRPTIPQVPPYDITDQYVLQTAELLRTPHSPKSHGNMPPRSRSMFRTHRKRQGGRICNPSLTPDLPQRPGLMGRKL